MKRIIYIGLWMVILAVGLGACNDQTNMRKKITGKAGELVVVVPDPTWEGATGKSFREIMAQPQLGLPQDEPIFDLINVPPSAFKEIFRTSRNIVRIKISTTIDTSEVKFRKDIWAWPQAVVDINASSTEEFNQLLKKNSDRIVAFMLKAERDRLQMNYRNYHDKAAKNIIKDKFNIQLNVPPGFKVTKQEKDFVWVRYETPDISQGIMIHSFPYQSDSTFTQQFLLNKRDSILKANVAGPAEGSYMTTERQLPPVFNVFQFKKNYASEMRGLWRVEGDFMGGPYINLTVLDAANNRIVMLDGYVYAPRFDKRNLLRQVEAMMYSLELPDQQKNDKINSQVNMGN
ncbi:DUF4837 family protein [Sunxiuqinia elliptica]|uniref:Uncharacterized protein DUF4837 n=1 Tax=Sunxiuqinia elliptica TaxID=655355 RepID=A0A4R6H6B3_9BACT|nr:DUF4837 family protein [Sunxiuqinia elliptica]TDO03752.1 uncharacterized protein DUF4837 [Sunxiuqinia elliptica]TDO62033.1 uncharacterized protein DUF4837 [Sunxiuqinia elliptica]